VCSELQKTHLCCNSVGRKRIFTSNSRSRSFKIIHFAISYRPTRGRISPYNTAGLISEDSEEAATEIAKNCRRHQPHSHLMPPPRGTPANIPINLIFLETRIIADSVGLSSFQFEQWAPKNAYFLQQSAFRPFKVIQSHPMSISVPIESAYVTSY